MRVHHFSAHNVIQTLPTLPFSRASRVDVIRRRKPTRAMMASMAMFIAPLRAIRVIPRAAEEIEEQPIFIVVLGEVRRGVKKGTRLPILPSAWLKIPADFFHNLR